MDSQPNKIEQPNADQADSLRSTRREMRDACGPTKPKPIAGFPDFGFMKLKGVENARDLGGLPTADGRRIKKRRLLRTGELHNATSTDIKQLIDMHDMDCIVDLRTDNEVEDAPDPKPLLQGIQYDHLSVLPQSTIVAPNRIPIGSESKLAREFVARPFETITGIYTKAVLGEMGIKAYSALLELLVQSEEGATLWHCTQGKDRTGIAAIIVEYTLGVPMEYIRADYLATNLFVVGWIQRVKHFLADKRITKTLEADLEAYAYASNCYFDSLFETINGAFGSMDNYITRTLGFGPDKQARLRELYLA